MNLLNFGLNFALPPKILPAKEIIVDTEVAIKWMNYDTANEVRRSVKDVIIGNKQLETASSTFRLHKTIKSINQKDIYVTKADKGNAVEVVDKSDYDDSMHKMLDDGPYKKIKKPPTQNVHDHSQHSKSVC